MKITALLSLIFISLFANAQTQKVGDYIESYSYNKPSDRGAREVQYVPDGGGFLCVNGTNRYTRALYGSNTEYRIETSDRPVFALFKAKNYRNVRFYVNDVQLDETEYCEARYVNGCRSYLLKDRRWGADAILRIECVAMHKAEGGYWHFSADGFEGDVRIVSKLCMTAVKKLSRNGDIGADKPGCFEPSPAEEGLQEDSLSFVTEAYAVTMPFEDKEKGHSLVLELPNNHTISAFSASRAYFESLSERIKFNTPDSMLNNMGSVLSLAADGAWDGETWLHGAIGWRMPLAGWRAGYLGDVLGWPERAVRHFDAYARSQVTDVPASIPSPTQDPELNLARAEKRWGTQMYSNGYICRNPNRNDQMHLYDMNLNYIDELLWHFQYDADTAYMRKMWPVLTSHLEWEKRNFDKDGNHLYDAYCCIWASDALYYNGGEVTHSTAYNYRGNLLAAKIAQMIGKDPTPYQQEAEAILKAANGRLWTDGHWAEYRDGMGLKRLHPNAALWSVYTPIDCAMGSSRQMYSCAEYVDKCIPHIPVEFSASKGWNSLQTSMTDKAEVISTSNWMPYSWSINNVASAEIMHTALAFFEAGLADRGMQLVRGNLLDQMYLGASPGNLGQISYYDAARGESYRDFGDNIGISARAIIQGVFGIVPQALDGRCIIRPGFPLEWDSVEVNTPYLSYKYKREGNKGRIIAEQHFAQQLQLVVRINGCKGEYTDYVINGDRVEFDIPSSCDEGAPVENSAGKLNNAKYEFCNTVIVDGEMSPVKIPYNASVTDIFRNQYLSPRPESTSLELPVQGIGEWCHPKFTVDIDDAGIRSLIRDGRVELGGIDWNMPAEGQNILFASLWDNYPNEVIIPVGVKGKHLNLLIAGSTNHMQFDIDNAVIMANYSDGSVDTLALHPPYNYCPIEQDYYVDGRAFKGAVNPPLRVSLSTGKVSRRLGDEMGISKTEVYGRELKGGAAQILSMPLNNRKKLKSVTLRCLSNDVVVGIMAMTIGK